MKIDKDLFLKPFLKQDIHFLCPCCSRGEMEFDKDSYKILSTKASSELANEIGDYQVLESKFVSFLRCSNTKCQEISLVAGEIVSEERYGCDHGPDEFCGEYCPSEYSINFHRIRYIEPPVQIIRIPEEIPEDFKILMKDSFLLFWVDPPSSGNKIRKIIEHLMDNFGVDVGSFRLVDRVKNFGKIDAGKYLDLSKKLEKLVWLGNESSHPAEKVSKEDLLVAYELLEHIFYQVFTKDRIEKDAVENADHLDKNFRKPKK